MPEQGTKNHIVKEWSKWRGLVLGSLDYWDQLLHMFGLKIESIMILIEIPATRLGKLFSNTKSLILDKIARHMEVAQLDKTFEELLVTFQLRPILIIYHIMFRYPRRVNQSPLTAFYILS